MKDIHVYEVLPGEVIFRRSGLHGPMVVCNILRTHAMLVELNEVDGQMLYFVGLSMISSGSELIAFERWFADWQKTDCWNASRGQRCRPIDVAVPAEDLRAIFRSPERPLSQGFFVDEAVETAVRERGSSRDLPENTRPFTTPVTAVKVDGEWVFPLPNFGPRELFVPGHNGIQLA